MKFLSLITLLILASCGNQDFKKVEKLEGFRILSVVTATPEVAPGTPVSLQLFVSDTKGGGRVINGTTIACVDPGIAFGAKVNCDHDPSAVSGTYTVDTTTADMTSNLYTGLAADTANVTMPAAIFTGRSAREQNNGVGYIVIFNFDVDGKTVTAFKRVSATNRTPLNTNPTGSAILLNGSPISSTPAKDDKLKATSSAPETYDIINVDGSTDTRTEQIVVAWYVTHGEFDSPKSDIDETIKYLSKASSGPSLVVAIVRDERGGVDIVREFFP